MNKLFKIYSNKALYFRGNRVIIETINAEARTVLDWYYKNIPAND